MLLENKNAVIYGAGEEIRGGDPCLRPGGAAVFLASSTREPL